MMSRLAARSATRTGNRLLACTYSAAALASEVGVVVAVIRGDRPAAVVTVAAVLALVGVAVWHPGLLLRAVSTPDPATETP